MIHPPASAESAFTVSLLSRRERSETELHRRPSSVSWLFPVGGREGGHKPLDIVFMVVEMNREPQVAIPRRADDSLPGQRTEKPRWCGVAKRDADDRALVLFGQVKRVPSNAGERGPELGRELLIAGVDGVGPEFVEDGERGPVADRGEPADGVVKARRRGRQVHLGAEEAVKRDNARPPARVDRRESRLRGG